MGAIHGPISGSGIIGRSLFCCSLLILVIYLPSSLHGQTDQVCRCVVFRVTGIQDYFANQSQIEIMDMFLKTNQSLTLGLIMNHIGDDQEIVEKLKEGSRKGIFELAANGWNFSDYSLLPEEEQKASLLQANKKMDNLFLLSSRIFIPPYASYNNSTQEAMRKANFSVLSSDIGINQIDASLMNISYPSQNQTKYSIPSISSFNSYNSTGNTVEVPIQKIKSDINRSIDKLGYAVINLDPQFFLINGQQDDLSSLNVTRINNLANLIDLIISSGIYKIASFSDITGTETNSIITKGVTLDTSENVARDLYQTGKMVIGGNASNLIILLPNEGHESPDLSEEQRLIEEPYVPQNTVIGPETSVVWFNGDVDHDHKITLTKGGETILEGDVFGFNSTYGPIRLNDTGVYSYYETDVINDDPNFVMKGNITVIEDSDLKGVSNTSKLGVSSDRMIVGTFMVPTQDLHQYIIDFQNHGLIVENFYTFKDLRGGQEGTGDEQTLLVWNAKANELGLDHVIQALQEITRTLPYV